MEEFRISKFIRNNEIHRFKAPKNKIYKIMDIHGSVISAGNNELNILDYLIEDEGITTIIALDKPGFLASFSTDIAGNHVDFNFSIPQTTKFISIGSAASGTVFSVSIVITGWLAHASKTELILEWFRKGI